MADNSGLIKIALFGGAAYLAYEFGWLSFLGLTPTPAAATAAPAPSATPTLPAAPVAAAPSVLDGIFARIQAKAGTGAQLSADGWGWYLNNELSALGKPAAPDPGPIFNLDRSQPLPNMSAAAWWGPMSQALKSQLGLSGLGIYGGLAAAMMGRAR